MLSIVLVFLTLAASACGGSETEATSSSETVATVAGTDEPTTTGPGEGAAGDTTQPDEPATEESGSDDGTGGATLTIGDETWTFATVDFCGKPDSPDTSSFVLIAKLAEWQLIAEVVDDSGEQRLEGDGVYDTISFQNNADPTLSWLANLEAAEVKFMVIEGPSVTASTTFDAVTGLSDDTPGTLEATCP